MQGTAKRQDLVLVLLYWLYLPGLAAACQASVVLRTQEALGARPLAQVWRVVHPPKRGIYYLWTCPLVHKGFLESYTAEGLNERLMQKLRAIMGAGDGGSDLEGGCHAKEAGGAGGRRQWRVLCTGHSLGGVSQGKGLLWRVGGRTANCFWCCLARCCRHASKQRDARRLLLQALATLASYDVAQEAKRIHGLGWQVQVGAAVLWQQGVLARWGGGRVQI